MPEVVALQETPVRSQPQRSLPHIIRSGFFDEKALSDWNSLFSICSLFVELLKTSVANKFHPNLTYHQTFRSPATLIPKCDSNFSDRSKKWRYIEFIPHSMCMKNLVEIFSFQVGNIIDSILVKDLLSILFLLEEAQEKLDKMIFR